MAAEDYYRARVRLVCANRWVLFKAFLRGRYEEAWIDSPECWDKASWDA